MMNIEYDELSGRVSAQCPDVYLTLYPAGHKDVDGRDDFYRGALLISHGAEHVHLNALDITDLLAFLADDKVIDVRKIMTKEHTATNLLRMLVTEASLGGEPDDAV